MSLPMIERSQLPQEQSSKLFPSEIVRHFGYIDAKRGGCDLTEDITRYFCEHTSTAKQWILVTDQRILFEAAVKEGSGTNEIFVHQSGSIPMAKVSYVGTSTTSQTQQGCSQETTNLTKLRINSSGGEIVLAIPTQEEAGRIQGVIDAIISKK